MDNPSSANPYESPTAAEATGQVADSSLWPLWVWLGVAVIVSFVGTPADPISMFIALAFGLVCFGVGCVVVSSLHPILRVVSMILGIAAAVGSLLMFTGPWLIGAALYGLLSIGAGVWAFHSIQSGRSQILGSFCAGYVLGSFAGPMGTAAGAALGAILAKRSLPTTQRSPLGSMDQRIQ